MPIAATAFLWHLHQPYYIDPFNGRAALPFCRLHAVRGYYDMIRILDDFPEARVTFNFSPSLLMQLDLLAEGKTEDRFEELSRRAPSALDRSERNFITEHFFTLNHQTMLNPHPRYRELFARRAEGDASSNTAAGFSDAELFDLQVWFNLAWFGPFAEEDYPAIAELKSKGGGFNSDDKQVLFDTSRSIVGEIKKRYSEAAREGRIEISISPLFHPILPLLYNSDFAHRADPARPLPAPLRRPEHARDQIVEAVDYAADWFGVRPKGMWPSEGSLAPELIPYFREAGLDWVASDQELLARSEIADGAPADHFHPWIAEYTDDRIAVFFRDRGLSDAIGFDYAKMPPKKGAEYFLGSLNRIAASAADTKAIAAIILDGENPWESYPDAGRGFLREVYSELTSGRSLRSSTFSDYLAEHPPKARLNRLHSGSWISANYNIWIGHPEENSAWRILAEAADAYDRHRDSAPPEDAAAARKSLFAAEGSDWFWWYGDDFTTAFADQFDSLFRAHAADVYRRLGLKIPESLNHPLITGADQPSVTEPRNFICPTIDGRMTKYFDWLGAGVLEIDRGGSMARSVQYFDLLRFGFDLENFYLMLAPNRLQPPRSGLSLAINISNGGRNTITFDYRAGIDSYQIVRAGEDKPKAGAGAVAIDRVVELKATFEELGARPGELIQFSVSVRADGYEVDRYPRSGTVDYIVPSASFELENWSA